MPSAWFDTHTFYCPFCKGFIGPMSAKDMYEHRAEHEPQARTSQADPSPS